MPLAQYRLFFDNAPVEQAQIDKFTEIRVDQAIGLAAEAQLDLPVSTDDTGAWSGQDDDFSVPYHRIRVEVQLDEGDFVPLIDGPVVAQRFELKAEPDNSHVTLVVHDDSVLLNREEKVAVFEDKAASEIAESLISEYGLTPQVDDMPPAGGALTRYVVQRGTNMQLLRQLARRNGMWTYVKPGPDPGKSIGVFSRPSLDPSDLPEIVLLGADRNIDDLSVEFDAFRPLKAEARSITITDKSELTSEIESSDLSPLGDEAVHDVLDPTVTALLARTREEQADIDAAAQAAVNLSSFAYIAQGEVTNDLYGGIILPYQVVSVAGIGGRLSGNYVVSRVSHKLTDSSYSQNFALIRNARSASGGGGLPSVPGGLF
jgi:phage protein D